MLEYFTYKKVKKNRDAKKARENEATRALEERNSNVTTPVDLNNNGSSSRPTHDPATPILDRSDERFLQEILSEDGDPPALPERPLAVPDLEWQSDDAKSLDPRKINKSRQKKEREEQKRKEKEQRAKDRENNKDKEHQELKPGRLSVLFSKAKSKTGDDKTSPAASPAVTPGDTSLSEEEEQREANDLGRVLERLNLKAKNNKVLAGDNADLLARFTQIFKDLANGVPTAYDDLVKLISDRDGTINKGFEKLPSSLQKLVTQLPEKLTNSLAPEILAAAAKSQGVQFNAEGGLKEATKKMLVPQNILELATKPGALVGMLRAIVTALKTRWPAFIGVNVLWSVALMLLMFVLWYCYKRGREERLLKEKAEGEAPVDGSSRIEELPDDPQLPAPRSETMPLVTDREPVVAEPVRRRTQHEEASSSRQRRDE
ncbi:uncharacterized protein F5Z01DRAFT_383382 [Emericellopsis atlantica]|uniref:Ring-like domain-containing protein n=1 Tax=Emericellopsis atlantica TaxID=2614577 RepID=A0A9P8CSH3_9HYPO|nr:uncharacterized protein F5Z01DRAFT_383382 [Emericellopsis atlantica]KAG9257352.1 hypothetical protein F5Z01DRAFT_383382 [Emericellopsis atlantica]